MESENPTFEYYDLVEMGFLMGLPAACAATPTLAPIVYEVDVQVVPSSHRPPEAEPEPAAFSLLCPHTPAFSSAVLAHAHAQREIERVREKRLFGIQIYTSALHTTKYQLISCKQALSSVSLCVTLVLLFVLHSTLNCSNLIRLS